MATHNTMNNDHSLRAMYLSSPNYLNVLGLAEAISSTDISTSKNISYGVLLIISLFITFFGYKHLKISVILQASIFGGYLGFFMGQHFTKSVSDSTQAELLKLIFAGGFGLLAALGGWLSRSAARFIIGIAVGIQFASIINVLFIQHISLNVCYAFLAGSGLVFGVLTFFVTRFWQVIMTAFVGSYWCIQALGNFFNQNTPTFHPFQEEKVDLTAEYYGYLAGLIGLSGFGIFVQLHITAKDVDHSAKDSSVEDETFYTKLQG